MHRLCLLCLILCPVLSWAWTPRGSASGYPNTQRQRMLCLRHLCLGRREESGKSRGLALDYLALLQNELGITLATSLC